MYTIDGWRVSIEETVAIEQIFRRTLGEDAVELYHDLLAEIEGLKYDLDQERKDFEADTEGVNPLICDIRDLAEEVENLLDSPRLTKTIKDKINHKVRKIKNMAANNVGRW